MFKLMMLSINLSALGNRGYEISVMWRVARMEILLAMPRVRYLQGLADALANLRTNCPSREKIVELTNSAFC